MVAWARVVELTCCGRKQAQNDAFATPAMIAAFVQLAPRAMAIASITSGTAGDASIASIAVSTQRCANTLRMGLRQLKPILYYPFRGLEALPAVNTVVYRGVPSSSSALVREKYQTGKDVYWTSFTSASKGTATAMKFALSEGRGGVIFRIRSLTGRFVKWYSSMPREGEVIFSPNSSFVVWEGPHDETFNGCIMCVVCLTERGQDSVVY